MGVATSPLWDAQWALYEALKADLAGTGVRVDYGAPLDSELQLEHVFVSAKATDWTFEHPLTNLSEDQDFGLIVGILVTRAGDQAAVVARMKELAASVDAVLQGNHTLSGTVDMAVVSTARLIDGRDTTSNKRQLALELDIACTAQANG